MRPITITDQPTQTRVCNSTLTAVQREEQILLILNTITPESKILTAGTSENKAFSWLINDDEAQVCPDNVLDVIQRYILAVVYFGMGGDNWIRCSSSDSPVQSDCTTNDERYLSEANVCQWFSVQCDNSIGNITGVSQGTYKEIYVVKMYINSVFANIVMRSFKS